MPETVPVWTDDQPARQGAFGTTSAVAARTINIASDTLQQNIEKHIKNMIPLLGRRKGGAEVSEIQLNLVVGFDAGVELVGKLTTSTASSITVTVRHVGKDINP